MFLYFARAIAVFVFVDPKDDETPRGQSSVTRNADADADAWRRYDDDDNVVPLRRQTAAEQHAEEIARLERALEDMAALEAAGPGIEAAPPEDEPAAQTVTPAVQEMAGRRLGIETAESQIRRFATECILADADGHVQSSAMRQAYLTWIADNELSEAANITVFGAVLASIIEAEPYSGRKERSGDRRFIGVRLKPTSAHRVSMAAGRVAHRPSTETVLGPMVRKLGIDGRGLTAS
jgi:hypothetical protein